MSEKFRVEFLKEVLDFLDQIEEKAREKILFNIDKAKVKDDSTLFKKLNADIWEFRTLYNKKQYRLFLFRSLLSTFWNIHQPYLLLS